MPAAFNHHTAMDYDDLYDIDDEPDPDDPRWYSQADDDGRECLTAAERNPSLCS